MNHEIHVPGEGVRGTRGDGDDGGWRAIEIARHIPRADLGAVLVDRSDLVTRRWTRTDGAVRKQIDRGSAADGRAPVERDVDATNASRWCVQGSAAPSGGVCLALGHTKCDDKRKHWRERQCCQSLQRV